MTEGTSSPRKPPRRAFLGGVGLGVPAVLAASTLLEGCTPPPTKTGITGFQVKDFGAKGDGVTDDTAAFGKAFGAVSAYGGGVVYVPPGRYRVSKLYVPSRCVLTGAGIVSCIQLLDDTNLTMLNIVGVDITVSNLQLDGNAAGQTNRTSLYNTVALFPPAERVRIHDCWVHDSLGYQVVAFTGCSDIVVARNVVSGGAEEGIECHGSSDFRAVGNLVQESGNNGIYVWANSGAGGTCHSAVIAGNVVSDWSRTSIGWCGILVDDGATDVTVTGNALAGTPGTGTGIAISSEGPPAQRVAVSANAVGGVAGVAIRVRNCRHSAISGNAVANTGGVGVQVWNAATGITVNGNVIDRSGNAGVQILNASDFTVRANVVRSSGRATKVEQDATGIVVYSRNAVAARGTVSANRAFDPASPATQVHGTGTAGMVTNVVFDANVVDGNAGTSHGTMLTNFPGGATLLPTRAIRSVAVGRTQVAVPHGLGHTPGSVVVTARSAGQVWQSAAPDASFVYLTADATGRSCDLLVG
jgi:hypothetical protein